MLKRLHREEFLKAVSTKFHVAQSLRLDLHWLLILLWRQKPMHPPSIA